MVTNTIFGKNKMLRYYNIIQTYKLFSIIKPQMNEIDPLSTRAPGSAE